MNRLLNNLFLLIAISLFGSSCYCQKKIFDTAAVRESKDWPDIHPSFSLSPDGKYAFYLVENYPAAGSYTLTIISSDQQWKKELIDFFVQSVTKDSKWCILRKGDSLGLLRLGTEELQWLTSVAKSGLVEKESKNYLTYRNASGDLVLRNLDNGLEQKWAGCLDFQLDLEKKKLLWQSEERRNGQLFYNLQWMELSSGSLHPIITDMPSAVTDINWNKGSNVIFFITSETAGAGNQYALHRYGLVTGKNEVIWQHQIKPVRLIFDKTERQLLIIGQDSLWYWREGLTTELLATKWTIGLKDVFVNTAPFFSGDGKYVFWKIGARQRPSDTTGGIRVNIWHYRDKVLPPVQSKIIQTYGIALNVASKKVVRIRSEGENAVSFIGKYALVERKAAYDEWCWQDTSEVGLYLISLDNGDRRRLPIDIRYINPVMQISPAGDYIIYYDPSGGGYCSYEIATGKVIQLTKGLQVSFRSEEYYKYFNAANPFFGLAPRPRGIAGWTDGDSTVLVYDSYDIWKLDPSGHQKPVNMTAGYGKQNHIVFELLRYNIYRNNNEWILSAFNSKTKYKGFYRKQAGIKNRVNPLIMGPYSDLDIYKAANEDKWLLSYSTPSVKKALYITKDFTSLSPLCILQPQKDYRWYTTELVNYKLPTGEICQGILFKPEDMDSTKKYPLLFSYYQTASDGAYAFRLPELADASNTNVPWFVSRGYLVFSPDIHYRMGHPGEGALQSVVSAAECLSKRPYVDANHMGLAGHSWGGTETIYIVAHSHLFAAASEGAGVTDAIANYNSIDHNKLTGPGGSRQPLYEIGQSRIGATLWQHPDLYIENSPILKANHITTPLLILHNQDDDAVSWSQGIELFTALRRLGKPAWMLEYDGEEHSLLTPVNVLDYTVRLTQFFDHLLKGEPAPKWMTQGVPQSMKSIESGLELDSLGKCSDNCLVCKKWNLISSKK